MDGWTDAHDSPTRETGCCDASNSGNACVKRAWWARWFAAAVVYASSGPGDVALLRLGGRLVDTRAAASAIGLESVDPVTLGADNFAGTLRVYEAAGRARTARFALP